MATVIDISNKIKNEEKFIAYNGKTYKVNDSKNNIIRVQALLSSVKEATIDIIDQAMEFLVGKDFVAECAGLAYEDYLVPFFAAMACVQGKTYEETEAAFRQSL